MFRSTLYTKILLHQTTLTQETRYSENLYTRGLPQRDAIKQETLCTKELLRQNAFTPEDFLCRNMFTPRTFRTFIPENFEHEERFTPKNFHTRRPLHQNLFTPNPHSYPLQEKNQSDNEVFTPGALLHQRQFEPNCRRNLLHQKTLPPNNFSPKCFTPDPVSAPRLLHHQLLHQTTFSPKSSTPDNQILLTQETSWSYTRNFFPRGAVLARRNEVPKISSSLLHLSQITIRYLIRPEYKKVHDRDDMSSETC